MGVPTPEVGYTPAMPRREDHEVHKKICGGIAGGGGDFLSTQCIYVFGMDLRTKSDYFPIQP